MRTRVWQRKVANPLALAVLAELMVEPMHPYEIGRRLKAHGSDRNIKYNRSSLYMVAEQLTKAGFIAMRETVRDTLRPERTVYALTDEGRRELHDWLCELVAQPRSEYPQFGLALSLLSVLAPAEAVELLTERLARITASAGRIRETMQSARAEGVLWVFLIDDEYELALLEAERHLVAGLVESLKRPAYIRAWQETLGSQK
ncbi:PadR family transcriptional regulator [Microtetraspora sp. NBRC 13810]|uniref:PadR family transcriptional regulator n=1 Tax=Microtetraspora sp. NBRC 13810 TaxID=3030990 RepID=UPI00255477F8|nr:PadR family transcriptional regulator [Microtetraspora sp. NBRC 13810]